MAGAVGGLDSLSEYTLPGKLSCHSHGGLYSTSQDLKHLLRLAFLHHFSMIFFSFCPFTLKVCSCLLINVLIFNN